jgi:hypothetical protein
VGDRADQVGQTESPGIPGQRTVGEEGPAAETVSVLPVVPPPPSHTVTELAGKHILIFVRDPHSRTITFDHPPTEAEIAEHEAHAIEGFASMDRPVLQDRRKPK